MRMSHKIHKGAIASRLRRHESETLVQIIISAIGGQADERPVMVLCAQGNALAQMRLHVCEADHIGCFRIMPGNIILLLSVRPATPINRRGGILDLCAAEFSRVVDIMHRGKFGVA